MAIYKTSKFPYLSFIVFGFISTIGWNSVLVNLYVLDKYIFADFNQNPLFSYPLFYFFIIFTSQFIYKLSQYGESSFYRYFLLSFILNIVSLVSILIVIKILDAQLSYYICLGIFTIFTISNSIFQFKIYGLCAFLPTKFIIALNYSSSISAIIIILIQYIFIQYEINMRISSNILLSLLVPIILYLSGIVVLIFLYKHPWFTHFVAKGGNTTEFSVQRINNVRSFYIFEEEEDLVIDQSTVNLSIFVSNDSLSFDLSLKDRLYSLINLIKEYYIYIYLIGTQSFTTTMMFPGLIRYTPLFNLRENTKYITLLLIFKLFELIGKYLPSNITIRRSIFERLILYRLLLFLPLAYSFIYTYLEDERIKLSIVNLITLPLFGFTSGYFESLLYSQVLNKVSNKKKDKISSCMNLISNFGSFLGSLFGYLFVLKLIEGNIS